MQSESHPLCAKSPLAALADNVSLHSGLEPDFVSVSVLRGVESKRNQDATLLAILDLTELGEEENRVRSDTVK